MSCRAIVIDEPKLPGGVGRDTVVCALRRLDRCDLVALSKECSDGFPHSCKLVRDVLEELHVPIAGAWLADRIRDLGESGCRQGIVSECSFADEPLRADVLCRRDRRCQPLAWVALDRGEMERAHRIFEYGCQLGEIDTCRNLGVLYEQKRFVEPIEGRGRKLVEWACEQTASVAREPAWAYEQCVRDALGP